MFPHAGGCFHTAEAEIINLVRPSMQGGDQRCELQSQHLKDKDIAAYYHYWVIHNLASYKG